MGLDTVLTLPPPTPGKQDEEAAERPWWEQEFDGRGIG